MKRRALAVAVLCATGAAACSAILGIDDLPSLAANDGGGDDVVATDGGADADAAVLTLIVGRVAVPRGKSASLSVQVTRPPGVTDPIDLSIDGLPAGVTAGSATATGDSATWTFLLTASDAVVQAVVQPTVHARVGSLTGDAAFTLVVGGAGGELDTSFGDGGVVELTIGEDDNVTLAIVQPDMKLLVGGYTANGGDFDLAMARWDEDGKLDPGFGTGGQIKFDLGFGTRDYVATAKLQRDGKILVTGDLGPPRSFAVLRLLANGARDPSLGPNGVLVIDAGPQASVGAGADTLLLSEKDSYARLTGYTNDGGSFAGAWFGVDYDAGRQWPDWPGLGPAGPGVGSIARNAHLSGAVLAPDLSAQAAGVDPSGLFVIGLGGSGTLNPSFGDGGIALALPAVAAPALLLRNADGTVVALAAPNGSPTLKGTRLTGSGAVDPTFGDGGALAYVVGSNYLLARGAVLQADGRILFVGRTNQPPAVNSYASALVRLAANGTLDPTFGDAGVVTTNALPDDFEPGALALAPDGRIVVAGMRIDGAQGRFRAYRFWP